MLYYRPMKWQTKSPPIQFVDDEHIPVARQYNLRYITSLTCSHYSPCRGGILQKPPSQSGWQLRNIHISN